MTGYLWEIALLVIGLLLSGIGTLLGMNLQSIKKCLKKQDVRIDAQDALIANNGKDVQNLALLVSQCKIDCHRNFVTGEAFLRETGFMRRTLEAQMTSLSRIEGQLTLTDKLPEIVGEISRNIVREMKGKPQ